MSHPVQASEGLRSAAAYLCEPVRVARAVVSYCLRVDANLAIRYPDVLTNWERRNLIASEQLRQDCLSQQRELRLSEKEREELSALVSTTNDETIEAKLVELARNPKGCGSLVLDFASGKEDLQRYLTTRK